MHNELSDLKSEYLTRIIPFYTCLDLADPVDPVHNSTLDHQQIAHHLFSINTPTTIIQKQSYKANKAIIRTVHQQ
jgi:hypothetical protein